MSLEARNGRPSRGARVFSARGLYAIVDVTSLAARRIDPVAFAEAVLGAKPVALQVRAKSSSRAELVALLRALAPACRVADVPLVCNDDLDAALLGGADMLHLGQDDAPVAAVRARAPHLPLGLSTHDLDQLDRALAFEPAYVAFGPLFPTRSKTDASPVVGLDGLARAKERVGTRAPRTPLVGIGGIDLERAPSVAPLADAGAVISDLLLDGLDGVTRRASLLHEALGGRAHNPEDSQQERA